jgi:abortive infection bacteriophage resistance protein
VKRGLAVKYTKPALTFDQQADLLLGRGLVADKQQLVTRLEATSSFRLSGYLHPFRIAGTDCYQIGTTLEQI